MQTLQTGVVNKDGNLNAIDVTVLARYLAGKETFDADSLRVAGVNGDGNLNALDIAKLARYLAGKEMLDAAALETEPARILKGKP